MNVHITKFKKQTFCSLSQRYISEPTIIFQLDSADPKVPGSNSPKGKNLFVSMKFHKYNSLSLTQHLSNSSIHDVFRFLTKALKIRSITCSCYPW